MSQSSSTELFETAYILKVYHNEGLQRDLDEILPSIFSDPKKRLLIYLMKQCRERNFVVSISNMLMIQFEADDKLKAFHKKHKVSALEEGEIYDMVNQFDRDHSEKFFSIARSSLLRNSFSRFIDGIIVELKYYNGFGGAYEPNITALLRSGIRIHKLIYNRLEEKRDQLAEMQEKVNSSDEYISTSSQVLNSLIGGFSRTYVNSIIAKSSHGKSSWIDYNILHNILSGKVSRVDKITPEEDAGTQLRRYAAMICRLSTSQMRLKIQKITEDHLKVIEEKIGGKLFIHDNVFKYKEITECIDAADGDMIVVDHINSIEYPGSGSFMDRMIGGIPGLIQYQKSVAKKKKCVVVNLSQVNDKDIQRSDRLIKAPRYWDAYGSSVLYQAAREFIALWYPYKDQEETVGNFGISTSSYTPNDFFINIEKSSFSKVGKIAVNFVPEYNLFNDKKVKESTDRMNYVAPPEKEMADLFSN